MIPLQTLTDFSRGYIRAALFTETDENDSPLDRNYSAHDISTESRDAMREECRAFLEANESDLSEASDHENYDRLGMMFWYNRNGHGVGFWDGCLPDALGERLSAASEATGTRNLYLTDEGVIEMCPMPASDED